MCLPQCNQLKKWKNTKQEFLKAVPVKRYRQAEMLPGSEKYTVWPAMSGAAASLAVD